MVLDVDGEALDCGIERGAVGECPGLEYSVHFQPQVIVETSCAMSLNKKAVLLLFSLFGRRLRSTREDAFPPVFF
jgi:hypothetical protein